jgi:hypothetical protein
MINFQLSDSALSISFVRNNRSFGPKGNRSCVECDVYEKIDDSLTFINRGIAICNPADTFDPRLGAHKALHSALAPLNLGKQERQQIHAQLDGWPWGSR